MNTSIETNHDSELAKSLAPEDIRCGDVVAVLDVVCELPSFLWRDDIHMLAPDEPVRIRFVANRSGLPLKVKSVCLPYVLVETPKGRHRTLDTRRCRLVRLSNKYAEAAWKEFGKKRKKKQS